VDFDFELIAAPFRMQPGLRRLDPGVPHLTPLGPGCALFAEKASVLALGQSRHVVDGFDPSAALEAIAAQSSNEGHPDSSQPLELAFEEDFAVLDASTGALAWLCVCVPSHWAPEQKVGLDFAAVHAPVADNAALLASGTQLVRLVTSGERWERHVWTISPSGRHDQHPHRHPRQPWPSTQEPAAFAQACFLRAERQTFLPVGAGTQQAVFTIRVMLEPVSQFVDTTAKAQRLHRSLASMSDAVLAYKGLTPARQPLLRWLEDRT
jgi:hypothetical protein